MNTSARQPVDFDFGDDLVNDAQADIRANAHIANGGDASFKCPKCNGRGRFISWSGRDSGPCFKCKGEGTVGKMVAAAAKGKITKQHNIEAWQSENAELIASVRGIASWNTFAQSLISDLDVYGKWTDNKVQAARTMLAKIAAKREEMNAQRNVAAGSKSGSVGVERINKLFETAMENGLKKPIFRTENLVIKPAKRHAGVLYVTDKRVADRESGGAAYVGKIVDGKFEARREAMPDTLTLLCEIASDPMEASVKYGRSTGSCGMCGRELTDPESVAAGIGPICAGKWGI